jgi:hypothetical protein
LGIAGRVLGSGDEPAYPGFVGRRAESSLRPYAAQR